jgi:two-component system LytT family response regulator
MAGILECICSPVFAIEKRIIIFTINPGESYHTKLLANGMDFLAKPFSADAVSTALPKAMRHYELLQANPDARSIYHQSLRNLHAQVEKHHPIEKITIPVRFGYQIVTLSELVYLQADENYTIMYLTNARVVVSNLAIDWFLQILPGAYFSQINAFTIINLNFLKIRSGRAGKTLAMKDRTILTVSKSRLTEFDKKVARHKSKPDLS